MSGALAEKHEKEKEIPVKLSTGGPLTNAALCSSGIIQKSYMASRGISSLYESQKRYARVRFRNWMYAVIARVQLVVQLDSWRSWILPRGRLALLLFAVTCVHQRSIHRWLMACGDEFAISLPFASTILIYGSCEGSADDATPVQYRELAKPMLAPQIQVLLFERKELPNISNMQWAPLASRILLRGEARKRLAVTFRRLTLFARTFLRRIVRFCRTVG